MPEPTPTLPDRPPTTMAPICQEPHTAEQWHDAVDAADALLSIDDARAYGLIRGGPEVDRGRCEELLRRGGKLGFRPRADALDRMLAELAGEPQGEGSPR